MADPVFQVLQAVVQLHVYDLDTKLNRTISFAFEPELGNDDPTIRMLLNKNLALIREQIAQHGPGQMDLFF
jgi:hypothetical protein